MLALGVLLMFLAGVLVDWSITGALSPWDWAALLCLAVLLPITLALRHREPCGDERNGHVCDLPAGHEGVHKQRYADESYLIWWSPPRALRSFAGALRRVR